MPLLKKFNCFSTFQEAKQSQEYDYFYQKAVGLATVSGVDLEIIRENNLHILEDGVFPLENYVIENNIQVIEAGLYEQGLKHWKATSAWSEYYRLDNQFLYFKDHSDVSYPVVELDIATLVRIDAEGNDIPDGSSSEEAF